MFWTFNFIFDILATVLATFPKIGWLFSMFWSLWTLPWVWKNNYLENFDTEWHYYSWNKGISIKKWWNFLYLSHLRDTYQSSKRFESCSWYKIFDQLYIKHLVGAEMCVAEIWQASKISLVNKTQIINMNWN